MSSYIAIGFKVTRLGTDSKSFSEEIQKIDGVKFCSRSRIWQLPTGKLEELKFMIEKRAKQYVLVKEFPLPDNDDEVDDDDDIDDVKDHSSQVSHDCNDCDSEKENRPP